MNSTNLTNYVDLPAHYRPKTFNEVVGQPLAVTMLKKVASSESIAARAIFIKGAYGSGKTTLARIFGRAMNCENYKKLGDVCNECPSCLDSFTKNTQSYYEFDAATAGNVEGIRNLETLLSVVPKKRRAVVMDEVHACSPAALNAMLKMVEEGIKDTIFIFCSTENILATLKSRSVPVDVTTVPIQLMLPRLQYVCGDRGIEISEESLTIVASKSLGHFRDALHILQSYEICGEDALQSSYSLVKQFFNKLLHKDPTAKELISSILCYTVIDIRTSILTLIRNIYISSTDSEYSNMQKANLHQGMFAFFYSPVAQQALKDEVGVEILLTAFMSKVIK